MTLLTIGLGGSNNIRAKLVKALNNFDSLELSEDFDMSAMMLSRSSTLKGKSISS